MARRKKGDVVDGVLVLDKPTGLTSNAALQRVRKMLNAQKAGHTGSLDPLATGVLPLCFGEATKYSKYLLDADKAYETTAVFGVITDSGDSDGNVVETREVPDISGDLLEMSLEKFRGPIEQVPSMFSALKFQGRPLYELARQGIEVERPSRPVTIYALELKGFDTQTAELSVSCSKGTYVRSLVEDVGLDLGCGAHLNRLRRTRAGHYSLSDAVSLEELTQAFEEGGTEAVKRYVLPVDTLLPDLPKICINSDLSQSIFNGQTVRIADCAVRGLARLYIDDRFIGVGEATDDGSVVPKRLVQTANERF